MRLEPALDRGGLMGGVVVEDEMQIEIGGGLSIDQPEEAQELPVPMARQARADDLAVQHAESGEQGGGAVALVVVGHGAGAALLHGQSGLRAIERLDLALLV